MRSTPYALADDSQVSIDVTIMPRQNMALLGGTITLTKSTFGISPGALYLSSTEKHAINGFIVIIASFSCSPFPS